MKTTQRLIVCSACLAVLCTFRVAGASPQSTAFTYQGQLKFAGVPVNGPHDFKFRLYDSQTAVNRIPGSPERVFDTPTTRIRVTNGVFSTPLNFGQNSYLGAEQWLEMEARPVRPVPVPYTKFPRELITAVPFALQLRGVSVTDAGNVGIGTDDPDSKLEIGASGDLTLRATGNDTGDIIFLTASDAQKGRMWTEPSVDKLYLSTSDNHPDFTIDAIGNVGMGTTAPRTKLDVWGGVISATGPDFNGTATMGASEGNAYFGNNYMQNIVVDPSGNVGIGTPTPTSAKLVVNAGVAGEGLDLASSDSYANLRVIRNSLSSFDKDMYIGYQSGTTSSLHLYSDNNETMTVKAGNVGIGTPAPRTKLDVWGGVISATGADINGTATISSSAGNAYFGNNGMQNIVVNPSGNVGIGTDSPGGKLGVVTPDGVGVWAESGGAGLGGVALRANNQNPSGIGIWSTTNSADANFVMENQGSGDFIRAFSNGNFAFRVENDGKTTVKVLTITGGADLAEPFDVSGSEVEPGKVVVIDPDQPGKLKLSAKAYDRTVAGIISGAGGVQTGMIMGQQGSIANGAQQVALTGRVYCSCDASNGAIEPGDLLTTSATPGHAMKVTDHGQAQGAIIGKAMTHLPTGEKGLVLVLVSLQ